MATLVRVVRPYVGLEPFERLVDLLVLRAGGEPALTGGRIVLEPDAYRTVPMALEVASDERILAKELEGLRDACDELGVELRDLELVVTASSRYLRRVDLLTRVTLDSLSPSISLASGERPLTLRTARTGARVEVFVCLARTIDQRPLRPWRRGTWLARASFSIVGADGGGLFRLRPLDEHDRLRLGLPKGCARFVELTGSATQPGSDESTVTVWLDPGLLGRLSLQPDTPAARAFQIETFLDVVRAVLARARDEGLRHATIEALQHSLFLDVLESLAQTRRGQPLSDRRRAVGELLDAARDRPSVFMALVEARVGFLRTTLEAVGK